MSGRNSRGRGGERRLDAVCVFHRHRITRITARRQQAD